MSTTAARAETDPSPGAPSSLREAHAAHTRDRLLQAAIDVILDDGADELSLREVARKAGVSAPTAYRHFPTRPELLDAVIAFIDQRMQIPLAIRTVEELIAALPVIHASFTDNARLMRAYLRARAATDLRDAGRRNRARRVAAAVRRSLPKLADGELQGFGAVMQLFSSSASWEIWRDLWGLEGERGGRVAAWAVKALYDAVREDPAAFARAAAPSPQPKNEKTNKRSQKRKESRP